MVDPAGHRENYWLMSVLALWASLISASASEKPIADTLIDPSQPKIFQSSPGVTTEEAVPVAVERWQVRFIRISPQWQSAIINGRLVTPGDEVDGLVVVKILRTEVVGTTGKETVQLSLGSGGNKQNVQITPSRVSAPPSRSLPTGSK